MRARALEAGLAYELIAARADLAGDRRQRAHAPPASPTCGRSRGWRRELVGEELLALLRGERSVAVGAGGRLSVSSLD